MPRLIWTRPALDDVQRLYRFLATKDPAAAKRVAGAIRSGIKMLAHQPYSGRPAEEMEPEYREWLIEFGDSGYVVLYRVDIDIVAILAIRHQREAGY